MALVHEASRPTVLMTKESPMLNLWRHPKTQEIRLYLARSVMQDAFDAIECDLTPSDVRAWLEQYESRVVVRVLANKGVKVDKVTLREVREQLEQITDLSDNSSWDDLVASAQDRKSVV